MSDSDEPCPKCGKHQWWQSASFLSKDEKKIIMVSHCDHCHARFKAVFKLVLLVGRTFRSMKVAGETGKRQPSVWNLFAAPLLKQGKGIAEVAQLWQKHKAKGEVKKIE